VLLSAWLEQGKKKKNNLFNPVQIFAPNPPLALAQVQGENTMPKNQSSTDIPVHCKENGMHTDFLIPPTFSQ